MPSERLTEPWLPPVGERYIFFSRSYWPPYYIDAPFYYVMGAPQWAEELDRAAWLEDVKQRLGLITLDDDEEARASRVLLANEDPVWPELEPEDKRTWRRIIPIATN